MYCLKILLAIKIYQSKDNPNGKEYVAEYKKKTTVCCIWLLKASDQRAHVKAHVKAHAEASGSHLTNQDRLRNWIPSIYHPEASDDIYIGDSWFGSVASAIVFNQNSTKAILQVKMATSRYPKKFIEEKMKSRVILIMSSSLDQMYFVL